MDWLVNVLDGKRSAFPALTRYQRQDGSVVYLRQGLLPGSEDRSASRFPTYTFNVAVRDKKAIRVAFVSVRPNSAEHESLERAAQSLMRITQRINSTPEIQTMLDSLSREVATLTDSEFAWSGLRAGDGVVYHREYQPAGRAVNLERAAAPVAGWLEWVLANRVPHIWHNRLTEIKLSSELGPRYRVKSGIAGPILDTREKVIGFFVVANKRLGGRYSRVDLENVMALSRIASVALRNALNYRKFKEAAVNALLRAQDEERHGSPASYTTRPRKPWRPWRSTWEW